MRDSGLPHVDAAGWRSATASSMQNCAAPSDDAAWRMRFSCTKCWASSSPWSTRPNTASAPTRTSVSDTSAWSVGMLNVHQKNSTLKPGASVGTRKAVIPSGLPGSPEVRANTMSWVAWCRPELNRLAPLITHSSPSRTAVVSRYVASLPWFGSVRPKARRRVPSRKPGIHSATCSGVPKSRIISTVGKLPTIELSFCRSLWSPRPLVARCSRMIAISRLRRVAPAELGRQGEAQPAGGVGAAAHLARAAPPTPAAARRRCRSRSAPTRGGGRRSGCCRPDARADGSRPR